MDDCRSNREDLPGIEGSRFQLTGSMMMPKGDVLAPSLLQPIYLAQHGQVMTDEQLEALRRQISVYATICQQLVEMHKASVAQQSHLNSISAAQSLQYDQSITGYKTTARHRWTPSQTQLHLLEKLFDQGIGTPNKQKIKEITAELSQYGTISEANVYNWFQNRKARSKRKQQPATQREGESELDTDADSPQEKKAKSDQMQDYTSVHSDIDGQALGGQLNVDQHTLEMKGGQGYYEKSATSGDNAATITIFVNGKEWKVSAGVFNLKSSFGETAVLLNGQGQIIATNESGAILQPLSAGERYTLTELDGGRELDTFSPSTVHRHNTHQFVGSYNEAFAKRSTLHAHTQNQFHSM